MAKTNKERIDKAAEIAADEAIAAEDKAQAFKDWEAANTADNQAYLDQEYLKNSPPLEKPRNLGPTLPTEGTPKVPGLPPTSYSPGTKPNVGLYTKPTPPSIASLMLGAKNQAATADALERAKEESNPDVPIERPAGTTPPPMTPTAQGVSPDGRTIYFEGTANGSVPPNFDVRMSGANAESIAGAQGSIKATERQIRRDEARLEKEENEAQLLRDVEIDAAQRQGEKNAAREQGYLNVVAADEAKRNAENSLKEQRRQWYLQDQERKLQNLQDDMKNSREHPWDSRSTGQKVSLVLKTAVFGLISGAFGAPQLAINYLDNTINQDLAKQQREVNNQESFLSKARERFGDERQADLAAKTAAWGVVETNLMKYASQAKTVEQKQQANQLLAGIQQKKADSIRELMTHSNASIANLEASNAQAAAAREELALKARGGGRELKTLPIEAASQIADMRTAAQGVGNLVGQFKKMGPISGLSPETFSQKKREYEAMRDNVARLILRMESGAAITKDEADDMKKQVVGASSFSGNGIARLTAIYDTLTSRMNNRIDTYGRAGYDTRFIPFGGAGTGIKTNTPE